MFLEGSEVHSNCTNVFNSRNNSQSEEGDKEKKITHTCIQLIPYVPGTKRWNNSPKITRLVAGGTCLLLPPATILPVWLPRGLRCHLP